MLITNSDLGNNGYIFYDRIKPYIKTKMVDLGVRFGTSSSIMLEDSIKNENTVYGVDIVRAADSSVLLHPRYTFIQSDSVAAAKQWVNGNIDVLFVDTLHIKEQVLNELYHWMPFVKEGGLIVFHDTNWPADKKDFYKGQFWDRPEEAIKAYFNITELNYRDEFIEVDNYPESWGMTFVHLKKKSELFGKNIDWEQVHKFS